MPISSLIVQAQSGCGEAVAERLRTIPELEVTPGAGDRLVVVLETGNRKHDREVYRRIEDTKQVVAVNLIYANFEDAQEEGHLPGMTRAQNQESSTRKD